MKKEDTQNAAMPHHRPSPRHLSTSIAPHIIKTIAALRDHGYETYLVGGAVRDLLLGRPPKDYDVSTAATPEQVRAVFGRRLARIIGKRFRIVHLHHGREIIEISTFRRAPKPGGDPHEHNEEDPAHHHHGAEILRNDNVYGNAEEDAWRRDFTVNAIFYDPLEDRLIDHTGGIADVENKIVRVIGEPRVRFTEDPVRILRALKLVGQYGFTLTPETTRALAETVPLISKCPHSRLLLEFEKIIKKPYSAKIFTAFHEHGFLGWFLPKLESEWNSDACARAMQLLQKQNEMTLHGGKPDSMPAAVAAIALPFASEFLSDDPTSLWDYYPEIERDVRKIIDNLFRPFNLPRFILYSAMGAILLQPRLKERYKPVRLSSHPNFRIGRELLLLQNALWWRDDSLDKFWSKENIMSLTE